MVSTGCFFVLLSLCFLLNFAHDVDLYTLKLALLSVICGILAFVCSLSSSSAVFLFSSSFWISITFILYFILSAIYIPENVELFFVNKSLFLALLMLVGYFCGTLARPFRVRQEPMNATLQVYFKPSATVYWWLIANFIFFKILGIFLALYFASGGTALEVSASTQNQGAGYIFKIPVLSNLIYFLILIFAYRYGFFKKTAFFMTLFIVLEAIFGAGRYLLVTTILINLALYHFYVRSVRIISLLFWVPPLVFVLSLFGYVRNLQIGSMDAYIDTLTLFSNDPGLIVRLFVARLDMLPMIVEALKIDYLGALKFEGGLSYIYSLLHSIPRSIWPDKPLLTAAYVTQQVNPGLFAAGVNVYPSIMLEAYINFSWPGSFIVGVLLSWFSSFYDRTIRKGALRWQAFALLAFTFPMQFVAEGVHSNIFATFLYIFALYYIWLRLTKSVVGAAGYACFANFYR